MGFYNIALGKEIVPPNFVENGGIGGGKHNNQEIISVMDPETSKLGFYRLDGFKISETIFDEYVDGFSENLAPVYKEYGEKTGMIDIDGNLVFDYIFDSMTLPLNGFSIVKFNGKEGILSL